MNLGLLTIGRAYEYAKYIVKLRSFTLPNEKLIMIFHSLSSSDHNRDSRIFFVTSESYSNKTYSEDFLFDIIEC